MKETIWLVCTRRGFVRATKNVPRLLKDEIPVKVELEMDPAIFGPPTLTVRLVVKDWRDGLVMPDPELRDLVITEAEAAKIRAQRLAKMEELLTAHGYHVVAPPPDEEDEGDDADGIQEVPQA